jgi:hypothetical protein
MDVNIASCDDEGKPWELPGSVGNVDAGGSCDDVMLAMTTVS